MDNIDKPMTQEKLKCDNCDQEAAVFALQAALKVKACSVHAVDLRKHSYSFSIV